MKLTKDCKFVLDKIIEIPPDDGHVRHTVFLDAAFIETERFNYTEYVGILETLADAKAIKWCDERHSSFVLTEQGRNYKEIDRLEAKERWKERLIGFVVGALAVIAEEFLRCII